MFRPNINHDTDNRHNMVCRPLTITIIYCIYSTFQIAFTPCVVIITRKWSQALILDEDIWRMFSGEPFLCVQGQCHAGACLGLFVPVKGNCKLRDGKSLWKAYGGDGQVSINVKPHGAFRTLANNYYFSHAVLRLYTILPQRLFITDYTMLIVKWKPASVPHTTIKTFLISYWVPYYFFYFIIFFFFGRHRMLKGFHCLCS